MPGTITVNLETSAPAWRRRLFVTAFLYGGRRAARLAEAIFPPVRVRVAGERKWCACPVLPLIVSRADSQGGGGQG